MLAMPFCRHAERAYAAAIFYVVLARWRAAIYATRCRHCYAKMMPLRAYAATPHCCRRFHDICYDAATPPLLRHAFIFHYADALR